MPNQMRRSPFYKNDHILPQHWWHLPDVNAMSIIHFSYSRINSPWMADGCMSPRLDEALIEARPELTGLKTRRAVVQEAFRTLSLVHAAGRSPPIPF